jgi:hypothetical protein
VYEGYAGMVYLKWARKPVGPFLRLSLIKKILIYYLGIVKVYP